MLPQSSFSQSNSLLLRESFEAGNMVETYETCRKLQHLTTYLPEASCLDCLDCLDNTFDIFESYLPPFLMFLSDLSDVFGQPWPGEAFPSKHILQASDSVTGNV